jgi:hypothetical protein
MMGNAAPLWKPFPRGTRVSAPILETVSPVVTQYRDQHDLGLHEYLPGGNTDRVGRFTRVLALCHKYNIRLPRIIITEWGVDSDNGEPAKLGYKARGWSAQHYLNELMRVYKDVYEPWVQAGVIVGMCLFSYGDSGGWEAFDVSRDVEFINGLNIFKLLRTNEPAPAPQPDPRPVVTISGWKAATVKKMLASSMNVRATPSTASEVIGTLKLNDKVNVVRGWAHIELSDGRKGQKHTSTSPRCCQKHTSTHGLDLARYFATNASISGGNGFRGRFK